jgi:hypothetical protein
LGLMGCIVGLPVVSSDKTRRIPIWKGTWWNGQTFVIESGDLGLGGQRKILLSFSRDKLNLHRTDEWGAEASIDGKQRD